MIRIEPNYEESFLKDKSYDSPSLMLADFKLVRNSRLNLFIQVSKPVRRGGNGEVYFVPVNGVIINYEVIEDDLAVSVEAVQEGCPETLWTSRDGELIALCIEIFE